MLAIPLYPLLIWQGRRLRKSIPKLSVASGSCHGLHQPERPTEKLFRLICIGESPVAGIGVEYQDQAVTSQLAQKIAVKFNTNVAWQAMGENGADLSFALSSLLPRLAADQLPVDLVIIAFGINDTTSFRSVKRFSQELQMILDVLAQKLSPATILVSGVPPIHLFPSLPQPLRLVLGLKAAAFDQAIATAATINSRALYVPMQLNVLDRSLMASDGYHPSALGSQLWAAQLLAVLEKKLSKK